MWLPTWRYIQYFCIHPIYCNLPSLLPGFLNSSFSRFSSEMKEYVMRQGCPRLVCFYFISCFDVCHHYYVRFMHYCGLYYYYYYYYYAVLKISPMDEM